jgi:ornithine decarboxylase
MQAKFILSKRKLLDQVKILEDLGLKISYSYKTNREVGNVLQDISDVDFSIHAKQEIDDINDKNRVWFFTQAESEDELKDLLERGIRNFVIDNEVDLDRILNVICRARVKINLSLRMKFKEHRIGSGKYFVYGMGAEKVKQKILEISGNEFVSRLGVHIHRKSQNTSEWGIKEEIEDSLGSVLDKIQFINFGGGLPVEYRSYSSKVLPYIFGRVKDAADWLKEKNVESYIEPGRFLCAPCVRLETEIIQVYDKNIVINTTIFNCALDCVLTNTKMLVEDELDADSDGCDFLIKGNSPTRDDIFRYKVRLGNSKSRVGEKIVFLNAGAYNYTTDFFGYKKLGTEIVE